MFLSIIMPRGMKNDSGIKNKREERAIRFGQSLGIVLVTPKKQNAHR
jgi:hypothetical protein